MADVKPLINYAGSIKQIASTDKVAITNLATGTATGGKFIRDDGTLQIPKSPATKMFNYLNYS